MNESAGLAPRCERCGAPIAGAPEGLCPRCLMALNLATQTEASDAETGPHGTKILRQPPAPEEIAKRFPQLEILDCLGRGGMGVVYKARQPRLDRLVALKVLAPERENDPQLAERFAREARALARLNHPNIVTVHDFGQTDGLFYLIMEYVDGASLRQLLQARKIAPEEALAIVPKICEALQYAHDQGVVHRDIKPENVLLDKQGRVKIADFGIAKIVGQASSLAGSGSIPLPAPIRGVDTQDQPTNALLSSNAAAPPALTDAKQIVGTPHYMAPEQLETPATVDHRADIYSLGVVFYEMLTGELPLGKFAPPSQKVQIDVRLDEVVLHAMEKEPERRYQQANQIKSDVETIATGTARAAAGRLDQSDRTDHRKRATSRLAGTALCFAGLSGLLGGVAFCLWPPPALLVGSILLAALLGIGLAMPERSSRLGKQALVVAFINVAIWLLVGTFVVHRVTSSPGAATEGAMVRYRLFEADAGFVEPSSSTNPPAEPDYVKAEATFKTAIGLGLALQQTIEQKDDLKLALDLSCQFLDRIRAYNDLVRGTQVEIPPSGIEALGQAQQELAAGKWAQAKTLFEGALEEEGEHPTGNLLEDLARQQSGASMTPVSVALDSAANIYVADYYNNAIRKIAHSGFPNTPDAQGKPQVSLLAGDPFLTTLDGSSLGAYADGIGHQARFSSPFGLAVDSEGNVYVGDFGNEAIRRITPDGIVSTLAGSPGVQGSADGAGSAARFNSPHGVAVAPTGILYIADTDNNTIRQLTPASAAWLVTTVAGHAGSAGSADGPAASARFNSPHGVAADNQGNLFVADTDSSTIRKLTPTGTAWQVSTIAGMASKRGSADGFGRNARFNEPYGVAVDAAGLVYVADTSNNTIRRLTPAGTNWLVTTIAGRAREAGDADGGGTAARFQFPSGLAVDDSLNIFVADEVNRSIRKVAPAGTNWLVTTVISGPRR